MQIVAREKTGKLTNCALRMPWRQERKRTCVNDTQSPNTIDPCMAVNNSHIIGRWTHLTRGARMPHSLQTAFDSLFDPISTAYMA